MHFRVASNTIDPRMARSFLYFLCAGITGQRHKWFFQKQEPLHQASTVPTLPQPQPMEFLPEPQSPHPPTIQGSWSLPACSIDGLCTSLVSRTGPSVESAPVIDCLLNTCITGIGRGSGSSVIWQRGVSGQEEGVTEGWGLMEEAEFCSALFHNHP